MIQSYLSKTEVSVSSSDLLFFITYFPMILDNLYTYIKESSLSKTETIFI